MKAPLTVIVAIAILVGIALAKIDPIFDDSQSYSDTVKIFFQNALEPALEELKKDIGRYPTNIEGLSLLSHPPIEKELREKWRGPYIDFELPPDPFGRPYQYHCPGERNKNSYDVFGLGPDGIESKDDVGNWN